MYHNPQPSIFCRPPLAPSPSLTPTTSPTVLTPLPPLRLSNPTSFRSLPSYVHLSQLPPLLPLSLSCGPTLHHPQHPTNEENHRAVATSSNAGRRKATRTTSSVPRTLSSSFAASAVKIARQRRTQRKQRVPSRSPDRPISQRPSARCGRVCPLKNVRNGSRWQRIERRSTNKCILITSIDLSDRRIKMARQRPTRRRP
jgi:hypothetical protein